MLESLFSLLQTDASYVVATVLVCVYAANRFNTPRTVRSQTSRFQYFSSLIVYVFSCELLMLAVAWLLQQEPAVMSTLLGEDKASIPAELTGLQSPLVAALILTTLLPSFPILHKLDAGMLQIFHRLGAIPINAVRWSQRMDLAPFAIMEDALVDAQRHIREKSTLPDTLIAELTRDDASDRTRFAFTRVMVLYVAQAKLPGRPSFEDDFKDDVEQFEKAMAAFFADAVGYFALATQLEQVHLRPTPDADEGFRKRVFEAYSEIRLMLARTLLYSCKTEASMVAKLRGMGFEIDKPRLVVMPFNLLCADLVGVVVLFSGATLISSNDMPFGKALTLGLLVALNHCIAAVLALLPKQKWTFADIRCANERPHLAYLISALGTLLICLPVTYIFCWFRLHFLLDSGPFLPFAAQCKWLILSMVLSAALAFECDDFVGERVEPRWVRPAESALLAILMALAGWLVRQLLLPDQIALHPNGPIPSLWAPVWMSAAIGALFGATIPAWYRKTEKANAPERTLHNAQSMTPQAGAGT